MNKFLVRTATIEDIPSIARIAEQSRDKSDGKQGFLTYVLSKERYAKRLNDFFVVAETDQKIIGFMAGYSKTILNKLIAYDEVRHIELEVKQSFNYMADNDFIFCDQIAVLSEYRNQDVGTILMQAISQTMKEQNIRYQIAYIMHEPNNNLASQKFFLRFGGKFVTTISLPDDTIWGMYIKEIS